MIRELKDDELYVKGDDFTHKENWNKNWKYNKIKLLCLSSQPLGYWICSFAGLIPFPGTFPCLLALPSGNFFLQLKSGCKGQVGEAAEFPQ